MAALNHGKTDLHEVMPARRLAMTEKLVWMLLKGAGLLSGEMPIIGSDDSTELEAEKEREKLVKIMSRPF